MKKPGKWIATFGPSLRVSRVNVEASSALDLVEVTTVGEGEQLTDIFYFDRVEAADLVKELQGALDQLEEAAVDRCWEVVFAKTSQGKRFVPINSATGLALEGYTPQVMRSVVEEKVESLNSTADRAMDHPPPSPSSP